ncbi:MAG: hypothetical protein LBL57_09220 [Tannerella sp.]|jgi:hypothetical protein|nr:hypothetical protein [Tannerella sp.]
MNPNDLKNINTVHTDFRSDVIAAGLAEEGFDLDSLLVLRREAATGESGKEIAGVEFREDADGKEMLVIKTSRRGIYDNLPEGLFHSFHTHSSRKAGMGAVVEEMRKNSRTEFYVRLFFSLFEAETERSRICIQLAGLRYDKPERFRSFADTLLPFWPVIRLMDIRTACIFSRMIPFIPSIRNSFQGTAEALSLITGQPVRIRLKRTYRQPRVKPARLGEAVTGINAVLNGKYCSAMPDAFIHIALRGEKYVREYLPGAAGRIIVEKLSEIFIPAKTQFEVCVTSPGDSARLGDREHPCFLGVNTVLKSKCRESKK